LLSIIYNDNLIFNHELDKKKKRVKYINFTISPNSKINGNTLLTKFVSKEINYNVSTNQILLILFGAVFKE